MHYRAGLACTTACTTVYRPGMHHGTKVKYKRGTRASCGTEQRIVTYSSHLLGPQQPASLQHHTCGHHFNHHVFKSFSSTHMKPVVTRLIGCLEVSQSLQQVLQ